MNAYSERLGEYQQFDAVLNRQRDAVDRCSLKRAPEVPPELFEAVQKSPRADYLEAATSFGWTTLAVYYSTNNDSSSKALPRIKSPPPADSDTTGVPAFMRDNYRFEVMGKRPYGFEIGLPDEIVKSRWANGRRTTIAKAQSGSPDIFTQFLREFPSLNASNHPSRIRGETAITVHRRTKHMAAVMVRLSDREVGVTYACTPENIGTSIGHGTPGRNFVQIGNGNAPHTPDRHMSTYDRNPFGHVPAYLQDIEKLRHSEGHLVEVIVMAGMACRYSDIQFCHWPRGKRYNPDIYSLSMANYGDESRNETAYPDESRDSPQTTVLGINSLKPIAAFRTAIVGWQRIHYEDWI